MSNTLPAPAHDPEALWAARVAVREAFVKVRRLRQADPTIRCLLTSLDEHCVELSNEIEAMEPPLPFGVRVREGV